MYIQSENDKNFLVLCWLLVIIMSLIRHSKFRIRFIMQPVILSAFLCNLNISNIVWKMINDFAEQDLSSIKVMSFIHPLSFSLASIKSHFWWPVLLCNKLNVLQIWALGLRNNKQVTVFLSLSLLHGISGNMYTSGNIGQYMVNCWSLILFIFFSFFSLFC